MGEPYKVKMSISKEIMLLLSTELTKFSISDYIIAKAADIGTGLLWGKIKDKLPKKKESLEGQLYDAIERSVGRYAELNGNKEEQASACEILYGTWIKNGCLLEEDVKKALSCVNQRYLAKRNVELWYGQLYEEIINNELLYRWYMLHTTQNLFKQIKTKDERITKAISECLEYQKTQNIQVQQKKRYETQLSLRNQIYQNILKEKVNLKEIYISLHGRLIERNMIHGRLDEGESLIVDTTSYIWKWYEREYTPLLFLHGEPGSGKSSLVKMIAATMTAQNKTDGLVAFVELHRLGFNEKKDAVDVLEDYIKKHFPWFFDEHLPGKRLLIIDGMDEIRYDVHKTATELVQGLELCDWDISWSGIVSGRTQVVKQAILDVRGEELEILPLFFDQYDWKSYADHTSDLEEMLQEDLREIYWDKLTKVFQVNQKMPINDARFDELSRSPLLLFLIVWTMKNSNNKFEEFKNMADLYETIFRNIYTREYNRASEKEIYFQSTEYKEYHQMLHYLGGCAYKNNRRSVSIQLIYEYCKKMGNEETCKRWLQIHQEENPSKLVLLFFLRELHNKIDWQKSEIEFIHKTFYEYLAAIGLIEFFYRNDKEDNNKKQMEMMFYVFSDNEISDEILRFMKETLENESVTVDNVVLTKRIFIEIVCRIFNWGFNKEYPLKYIKDVCTYQQYRNKIHVYEKNLSKLLNLLINFQNAKDVVNEIDLSHSKFSDANMIWWVFDNINLNNSRFEESLISGASFTNCELENAIFVSAIADRTIFSHAKLKGADFTAAQLTTANFTEAILENTCFELASMEGAYFCDTEFYNTQFAGADLTAANFDNTIIINADFTSSDLTRADFTNVKIEHAVWNNCIMDGTKLNGVKLIQFDLDNPEIIEMLAEADLDYANWIGVDEKYRRILSNEEECGER